MPTTYGPIPGTLAGAGRALGGVGLGAVLAGTLAACASPPAIGPFAMGGVDPNSSVAAEVKAAERLPGPYPRLSRIPPVPADVRPAAAWRQAVLSTWAEKTATEREAAAIPFTLTDTEAWAAKTRARVNPGEAHGAPAGSQAAAEAFAASERARATPPPPSK